MVMMRPGACCTLTDTQLHTLTLPLLPLYMPQCRHLVDICDNILSSSPEDLLSHTVHLESVHLVPVSPGDQLVLPPCPPRSTDRF